MLSNRNQRIKWSWIDSVWHPGTTIFSDNCIRLRWREIHGQSEWPNRQTEAVKYGKNMDEKEKKKINGFEMNETLNFD